MDVEKRSFAPPIEGIEDLHVDAGFDSSTCPAERRETAPRPASSERETYLSTLVRAGLATALRRLRIGIAILDAHGHVITANDEFQRQCEVSDTMAIDPSGRLRLRTAQDNGLLARVLAVTPRTDGSADAVHSTTIVTAPLSENGVICLEVTPLDPTGQPGGPGQGALITSIDTSKPVNFDTAAFAQVYSLTKAERALAQPIADGLTNAQIAERRNRAVATVNVQVKSLLAKTCAANRTHFVKILSSFRADA